MSVSLWIGLGLYLVSMCLPTFRCHNGVNEGPGFLVLLMGWLGLITYDPRWLANLLFFVMAR
ncbi:MAG TPA: hypothetical protein VK629_15990, partial [Steroidobacteraceae bacterium]|nr:hypothetical protein [Steroidobacteraceae bacterium]